MDLKSKLSRLKSAGPIERAEPPPAPPSEKGTRIAKLRGLLSEMIANDRNRARDRKPIAPPRPLPGETIETAHGHVHRALNYLEPEHRYGRVPIKNALLASPQTIAKLALDEGLAAIDPAGMLLLDTETTGLSGGTGTIPFLIGMAFFEDQSLCVEQLVLRSPGEEGPMLRAFADRLARASCIVSYNGKSFDWPLLRNRFVLNRVPVGAPPPHLDLLHCARRIFKRRLGRVRLVHLEAEVLGMRREADIDGAEIPGRFWDFVREADGSALAPVIEHNASDLVALAAILAELVDRYEALRPEHEPADQLGVAQVAVRADDHDRAERYAMAAAEGGGPDDVTADAFSLAAKLARSSGDPNEEAALLERALEAADAERAARLHLALAKICEHKLRDYPRALSHALLTENAEGIDARDRRIARIEKRARQARLDVS